MTFFGFEFEVTLLASLFFYFCFAISLYFYAQPAKLDMLKGSVIFFVGNGLYAIAMGSLIVAAISVVIISYALLKYMQFSNILKLSKAQDIACLLVVSAIGIIAGYKVPLDLIVVLAFVLGRVGEFVPSPKLNKVLYVIAGLLYVGFALGDGMMAMAITNAVFVMSIISGSLWVATAERYQQAIRSAPKYAKGGIVASLLPQSLVTEPQHSPEQQH